MFLVFLSLIFSSGAFSKEASKTASVASAGVQSIEWTEFQKAEGDFDADGKTDSLIIETECVDCFSWDKETPPKMRTRITLTSQKTPFEVVNLTCFQCGGMKGGAIVGSPEFKRKGQLSMIYQGGSRFSWRYEFKWRWETAKSQFFLIGWTSESVDTARLDSPNALYDEDSIGNSLKVDVNALTRKIVKTVVGKKRKRVTLECKLKDEFKIISFDRFDFENFDEGDKHCIE